MVECKDGRRNEPSEIMKKQSQGERKGIGFPPSIEPSWIYMPEVASLFPEVSAKERPPMNGVRLANFGADWVT
jgi:hypothetical protein